MKEPQEIASELTHEELVEALGEAQQEILDLQSQLAECKWIETAIRKRTKQLSERIKELDCLYAISDWLCRPNYKLDDVLQGIVNDVPKGYQNPKNTWVRLDVGDKTFYSQGFCFTAYSHSSDIVVYGSWIGRVEVFTLPLPDSSDFPIILSEENTLLKVMAILIGAIVEHRNNKD
ncbi:MAG: hypothetical protein Q8Q33_09995 [Chlamydiota bacterium]|nr:hypothetical protein [Chlamydiota bacterium]